MFAENVSSEDLLLVIIIYLSDRPRCGRPLEFDNDALKSRVEVHQKINHKKLIEKPGIHLVNYTKAPTRNLEWHVGNELWIPQLRQEQESSLMSILYIFLAIHISQRPISF